MCEVGGIEKGAVNFDIGVLGVVTTFGHNEIDKRGRVVYIVGPGTLAEGQDGVGVGRVKNGL